MGFLLIFACLVAVIQAECSTHTKDGCGVCVGETWLDIFHCGWCNDADNKGCFEGNEVGPEKGSCSQWEWYGKGGAPGATCCESSTGCVECTAQQKSSQCSWCTTSGLCLETKTRGSSCNETAKACCESLNSCQQCQASEGCGWCASSSSCLPSSSLPGSCTTPADAFCCIENSNCGTCNGQSQCQWCAQVEPHQQVNASSSICIPRQSNCPAPTQQPDPRCCSDALSCSQCSSLAPNGCGWCLATSSCQVLGSPTSPLCPGGFASSACCETLTDCASCQAQSSCQFCVSQMQCVTQTFPCTQPADGGCCNAVAGLTCAQCVAQGPTCSFCQRDRQCSDQACASPAVTNTTVWQCDQPVLLACEALSDCGSCLGLSGCVWLPNPWIDGQPLSSGLCFTGGLFGLENDQIPGFVVSAPGGWFWGTCSITASSLLILGGSLIGAFILLVVITVIVCVARSKRRRRRYPASYEYGPTETSHDFAPDTMTTTVNDDSATAVETEPSDGKKKKSKKGRIKPVYYKPVDSVRVTNTRYAMSRQKK